MAEKNMKHRVAVTTGDVILSFPKVFESTGQPNQKGVKEYNVQVLIPKSSGRATAQKVKAAIDEVAVTAFGAAAAKKVRKPLRDGDKEFDEITEDGKTKGEKYPERAGHWFFNAKSTRIPPVYDRNKSLITQESEIYGGVIARVAVTAYAYATSGNVGIALGLEGLQKVRDGEMFGSGEGGVSNVASMFDELPEEDDADLDEVEEVEEAPAVKKPAPRKAAAKKKAIVEEDEEDLVDDEDLDDDIDEI